MLLILSFFRITLQSFSTLMVNVWHLKKSCGGVCRMLLPLLFSCLVKQQIQSLRRLTEYQMDLAEMEIFFMDRKTLWFYTHKKVVCNIVTYWSLSDRWWNMTLTLDFCSESLTAFPQWFENHRKSLNLLCERNQKCQKESIFAS